MPSIPFSVDAALFRELGERLVGQPHIALAELIKNAYDADATRVQIEVGPDYIEVTDNGHGMTVQEFKNFFMRVGSPHKEGASGSRRLGRPLTGSKGIGRLSVQFLAARLEMTTSAGVSAVIAHVDWNRAVRAGDLTSATADYETTRTRQRFAAGSTTGTRIRLTALRHEWTTSEFQQLAREVWALQSPFEASSGDEFRVVLESDDGDLVQAFDRQMNAWLRLWHAKLVGRLVGDAPNAEPSSVANQRRSLGTRAAVVELEIQFEGEPPELPITYEIDDCPLHSLDFEIRVFSLRRRQKFGIRVDDARDYLRDNGGVHIYDAQFHLPYYGPDTDWLGIEVDHSHRISRSKLLPEDLQVPNGMNFIPTNTRLFGAVHVNTGAERRAGGDNSARVLQIQVSRDRLVANRAFDSLVRVVRWAIDYYAMCEAVRAHREAAATRATVPLPDTLDELQDLLENLRDEIPPDTYAALSAGVTRVARAGRASDRLLQSQASLLGTLASAGMAALALQHETSVHLSGIRRVAEQLRTDATRPATTIGGAVDEILNHLDRISQASRIFGTLLDAEDREHRARMSATAVLRHVVEQVGPFLRNVPCDLRGIDPEVLLPVASLAEWTALFQNVLINAVNAVLDVDHPKIAIRTAQQGTEHSIIVEDNGVGVELNESDSLFEPFVRRLTVSGPRRGLGLGGTGLGLTITRMIANSADCEVSFVEPHEPYSTAFAVSWRE